LAVDRTVDAAVAIVRDAGRQAVRRVGIDQLHRDTVGALWGDRRAGLRPARVVERHPESPATAIARLRLQLAIEVGPARETRERQRPLGGVASLPAQAGGGGAGGG